jgi:diguanylate cyclase (GGDEF)-like protein
VTLADGLVQFWQNVVLRLVFGIAATLLGGWCIPLSEWLVQRAARRLPPMMREECERQWLADFHGLPAWLHLRSSFSLLVSRGIAAGFERPSVRTAKRRGADSDAIVLDTLPSGYDALTGLANRPAFERRLARVAGRLHPRRQGLAVILVGIDNIDAINQQLGHLAGDALVKEFGRRLRRNLRRRDHIGRIGGDEFAVVLANTSRSKAAQIAEQLRFVCELSLVASNSRVFEISASVGLSSHNDGLGGAEILRRAAGALRRARHDGRNCAREFLELEP